MDFEILSRCLVNFDILLSAFSVDHLPDHDPMQIHVA